MPPRRIMLSTGYLVRWFRRKSMSIFLAEQTWVAVDTETTGLNPWKHEIIEIGAIKFNLEGISERFNVLVKPKNKQDPRARAIHNISNDEIEEKGLEPELAAVQFLAFIEHYPLIFHNAPFDVSFLKLMVEKAKIAVPPNPYYDSLYLSRKYFPNRKSHSLQSLRELLGIDTGVAHRALADAEATAAVFIDTMHQFVAQISSKKKFQDFVKINYRFNKFVIKLPKNFEEVEKYFERYIKQNLLIKVRFVSKENKKVEAVVMPLEVMIFSQKIYLKALIQPQKEEQLIPVYNATFFDSDLGPLNF